MLNTISDLNQNQISVVFGGTEVFGNCNCPFNVTAAAEVYNKMDEDKNNPELTNWGQAWTAGKIGITIGFIGILTTSIIYPSVAMHLLPAATIAAMKIKSKNA